MPTYTPKAGDTTRSWYVIDATDVVLGRLAVEAAKLLRGKHKPTFTPNVDGGDFVIVINADKVAISGDKLQNKFALPPLGLSPAGCAGAALGDEMEKHADRVVEKAIVGMLPHNKLGRQIQKKLKVYVGRRASAHRPAADSVRDQAGGPVTETTDVTETDRGRRGRPRPSRRAPRPSRPRPPPRRRPASRIVLDRPIQTVGRRKEAVVRVRLVPGTGKFHLDGRTPGGLLPEQGAPAAHQGPAGASSTGWTHSTSSPTSMVAARPARPARCAWPSPAR